MKKTLLMFLIYTLSISCSNWLIPYRPSRIILKSGDTIDHVTSKTFKNELKYKLETYSKPESVHFSEIALLEIRKGGKKKEVQFLKVKEEDKYVEVEKIMKGRNLEVYGLDYSYTNTLAGGMTMSNTATSYYVRKPFENEVSLIGDYDPIRGNYKARVYDYFSDCPLLIEKLDSKEIRLRDGFKNIARFYINNCK